MSSHKKPKNEQKRLSVLKKLEILDTVNEQVYDDLTYLASQICGTPIALISLVDDKRQWFKSNHGIDAKETHRDYAFCSHAILDKHVFYVPDSEKDERFCNNPLVTGEPHVKFYAGVPLAIEGQYNLGTLCVIDHKPRQLSKEQILSLESLARQVEALLDLRAKTIAERGHSRLLQEQLDYRLKMEQDLREQKDRAELAEETKSLFLANMSHEIRTPLNGIIGLSEILRDKVKDNECLELVKTIARSGDTLLNIVNDILDLSKIEAGKLTISSANFDVIKLVEEKVSFFKKLNKKPIDISFSIAKDVPRFIKSDELRIGQILTNLLSNALKFTESGKVRTELELESIDNQNVSLILKVSDTGTGIAPSQADKLFQDFTQLENPSTKKYNGTGLGLAITKKLAAFLGGDISVESILGKGSTFTCQIRCQIGSEISMLVSQARSNIKQDFQINLKVLVVEDNVINQKVTLGFLRKIGINADVASDGVQAIEASEKTSYDLILMDCHMPKLDGYQATRRIKQSLGQKSPIIIALTAGAMKGDIDKCLEAGMDDFIAKPCSLEDLVACLRRNYQSAIKAS